MEPSVLDGAFPIVLESLDFIFLPFLNLGYIGVPVLKIKVGFREVFSNHYCAIIGHFISQQHKRFLPTSLSWQPQTRTIARSFPSLICALFCPATLIANGRNGGGNASGIQSYKEIQWMAALPMQNC
jgi:hypothetical protein